ncbi:MAG: hypothetical protein ACREQH_13080 [Candidatus Binatus sp.]
MDKPPKESKVDVAAKFAEAAISAIPIVGGPVAVLSELVGGPITRRRQLWFSQLATVVTELQNRVAELSKPLDQNEDFATAVLWASQIAIRTRRDEKLAALRNAVRNSALTSSLQEDLQVLFLRFIDELTASHLRVLRVLDAPTESISQTRREMRTFGGLALVIYHCVPELNGQGQFCEQLCRDLQNRGLVVQGLNFNTAMTADAVLSPRTTDMGKQFRAFIS